AGRTNVGDRRPGWSSVALGQQDLQANCNNEMAEEFALTRPGNLTPIRLPERATNIVLSADVDVSGARLADSAQRDQRGPWLPLLVVCESPSSPGRPLAEIADGHRGCASFPLSFTNS